MELTTARDDPSERIMLYLLGRLLPTKFYTFRAEIVYGPPFENHRPFQRRSSFNHVLMAEVDYLSLFCFFILRRMGKNKASAHHTSRIFIRVVCRFNSAVFAAQRWLSKLPIKKKHPHYVLSKKRGGKK